MKHGKKMLAVAIALMMLVVPCIITVPTASSENTSNSPSVRLESGLKLNIDYTAKTAVVIGFEPSNTMEPIDLDIPGEIDGNEVIAITGTTAYGEYGTKGAFEDCTLLRNVVISDKIQTIGASSFKGCTSLEKVTIWTDNVTIGYNAFDGCTALKNVELKSWAPDYNKIRIHGWAFANCTSLETFNLTASVELEDGESGTFYGCTSLKSFTVSKDDTGKVSSRYKAGDCGEVLSVDGKTLYLYPTGRTETSYNVPDAVEKIESSAFDGCRTLTELNIGKGLTKLGMMNDCTSLAKITVDSENGAFKVVNNVLKSKDDVLLVKVPGAWKEKKYELDVDTANILGGAFAGCENITEIVLRAGSTTNITPFAFYDCIGLETVTGMSSITTIGDHAFDQCYSLKSLDMSSVTSIGSNAFQYSSLESVTLPSGVTVIGDYAFMNCTKLETVTINGTSVNVGEGTFQGCSSLVFNDWTKIGNVGKQAFCSCSKITSVTIASGKSVGEGAFRDCASLKSADVNITGTLPANIFNGCGALDTLTLTGVTKIGNSAFKDCASLTAIDLMNVSELGDGAFRDCVKLKDVNMGTIVKNIGNYAFCGCSSIESITIQTGTTANFWEEGAAIIGYNAFQGCTSLATVTFSDVGGGCINLASWSFMYCDSLETITLPHNTAPRWGTTTPDSFDAPIFYECTALKEIHIGNNDTGACFSCSDGVLYGTDKNNVKYLIQYPSGKTDKSFEMPNDLVTICDCAMYMNPYLESVKIGSKLTTIPGNLFSKYTSLKSFDVDTANPVLKVDATNGALYSKDGSKLYVIPCDATTFSTTATEVSGNPFENCVKLASVTIPYNMIIGDACYNPFSNCPDLKEIKVTGSPEKGETGYYVDSAGSLYCTVVETIAEVTYTVDRMICSSPTVTDLVIHEGTHQIAGGAFANCTYNSISFPDTLSYIDVDAFADIEFYENDKTTLITNYAELLGSKFGIMTAGNDVTKYYRLGPSLDVTSPTDGSTVTSGTVSVKGTTDGVKVTIFVNGTSVGDATLTSGAFSKDVTLKAGSNTIKVVATGADGATTEKSITVTYSDTPTPGPALVITSPTDGSTVTSGTIAVKGTTDGAKVTIFVNGTSVGDATLTSGAFSKDVTLKTGSNTIKVVATGADGSTTEKSVTVTYDNSPTPTPTPSSDDGMTIALCVVFFFVVLGVICIAAYPGKK